MEMFYPYWLSHVVTSWEAYWHDLEIQHVFYFILREIQAVKFT